MGRRMVMDTRHKMREIWMGGEGEGGKGGGGGGKGGEGE